MEKKETNETPRAKTGLDADGNLQIRSSGKNAVPAPRRNPERNPGSVSGTRKSAPRRTVRPSSKTGKPASVQRTGRAGAPVPNPRREQSPQKSKDAVEYSFAHSGLFNNGAVKNAHTDATAVSEAAKVRSEQSGPIPDTNTRVMPTKKAGARADSSGKHTIPAAEQTPPRRAETSAAQSGASSRRAGAPDASPSAPPSARRPSFATKVTPALKPSPAARAASGVARVSGAVSAMNSISRALIYIAFVLLISIIFSVIIITNCNDIFAFVKSDEEYSITIEPGTDLNRLADQLKEIGVIEHKNTFKMYIKYRDKDSDAYSPGTYTVSPSMNYDQIISAITPKKERETISITIPEGYTVDQIIDLFVSKGMHTREEFEAVIQNGDFSDYWFIAELPENPDRYYRLEGYLFPDTYYFYTNMEVKTIIEKFLDNFEKKYSEEYKSQAQAMGYTTDQLITLASIIQAEGKERVIAVTDPDTKETTSYVDYGLISSVFNNRMKISMKLQSDATTLFALTMDKTGEEKVTGSNKYYDNPYNTYNIDGLPPGAICNPGQNAISFALCPDASPYYYFVSDDDGNTYFAKTLEEHNAIVARLGQ